MRAATLRIATLALLVVGAASCMNESGTGSRLLRVQVSGEPEETASYRVVTRRFEESDPGLDVVLDEVADKDDHLAKLATSFAGGRPRDVFLLNCRE